MPSLETPSARPASITRTLSGPEGDRAPPGGRNVRPATGEPTAADPWEPLRRFTSARIALGRAGGSVRTDSMLDFRLSHARARDAVQMEFHADSLGAALGRAGLDSVRVDTAAADRRTYLVRPDLGRCLHPEMRAALVARRSLWGARDLVIIVSDGLSSLAAERQSGAVLTHLVPLLRAANWSLYPIFIVPFGRVKLQDEIGEILGARHSLMLLGERPGLGSPDSLGAYFTFMPRAACTDADRNCVSNIRAEGLPPKAAAQKLAHLLMESARRGISGVELKDTGKALPADGEW